MPLLRSPNGAVVDVPDEQVGNYVGYEPIEGAEASRAIASPESPDRGVLGGINAAATGLLSGATLGASDYALKGILNQGQFERLAAEREGHPIAAGIGQVAGAIIPAVAAPESFLGKLPSGIVGHATADAVAAGRAIGGAEGIGRALAAGGVEGAIQNAGMYLSDTALGDRELSAEGLAASLGPGFAFGVGGGVAALGIEQGTIAARRLFSRAAGTDKAAQAAESAWASHYQSTVEANDAAADIARAKLAEARTAREQAQLAKQQAVAQQSEVRLRPVPGAEAPRAPLSTEAPPMPQPVEVAGLLHDRAMAAMDPARLAAWDAANGPRLAELMKGSAMSPITLEEATVATAKPGGIDWGAIEQSAAMTPEQRALQDRALLSKAQEEELAAAVAEHDAARADLDDILRRIEAPEVLPGVKPPEYAVPVAEWGPPGMKGYDPGNVPAPGPPSELGAATGDATAVGKKKLAEGTPTQGPPTTAFDSKDLGLTFDPETRSYFKPEPETASRDLLAALQGTESKLGAGEQLGKISNESPAKAEYVAKKLARREEDAAYFRERAKANNYAASEMSASEKQAQREAKGIAAPFEDAANDVSADAFFRELTRPKTRDAYVAQNIGRAMREEGSHAAALAKVEREWAEMGGAPQKAQPATWREFTASKMGEYMKSEGSHAAAMKRMSREWADAAGHPVSTKAVPDAVEDVAAVAQAATKYEKSSARLAEALGPDAPPAAQEAAKAFREAEEHAERKTMERTTRAIDDHAEAQAKRPDVVVTRKTAATPVAPVGPDWLDEARKLSGKVEFTPEQRALRDKQFREWEMNAAKGDVQRADAKLSKARVAETEAKIGARKAKDFAEQAREAAMKARPTAAEAAPTSTLGAIATTIGVAGELGVPGIPKPHDIPIIGPLLGTYLKYRAIKAAAGRFVGRIPATGDARAAALVARTKDKIATAVDRTLGLAAEMAPKARAPLVATAAALGHRLIDDGEPDAPKNANAQQQAAVRIREIANAATQPGLVTAMVRKELRGVTDPDLIAAAEQHLMARFEALNRVMPKAPPPNPYSKREWVPSPAAAHEVAQRLAVVHDPEAAFHDTTPAKAETLRDTWPRLLEFAQQRLIERVGDLKHPVPYESRLRNSLLFSVPLDDSMQPDHAAILQSANVTAQPTQPPAAPTAPTPSIAGNSNLTALYQTASDRRAMR